MLICRMLFLIGDIVTVNAFGCKALLRRFVGLTTSVVLVCKEDEYLRAGAEKRQPVCVGFPLSDIIAVPTEAQA
jgi:hypothetical protein